MTLSKSFEKVEENIYRLCVPFEKIFTSVFAFDTPSGWILMDSATTASDVNDIILPAMQRAEISPFMLVLSHSHEDHGGGLRTLAEAFPKALVGLCDPAFAKSSGVFSHFSNGEKRLIQLEDGMILGECIKVFAMGGHSCDSAAFFDLRTRTLVSGDCVQLCGVGKFGTGLCDGKKYFDDIDTLARADICNIITSHEYVPCGFCAMGSDSVLRYLEFSKSYAQKLKAFAEEEILRGNTDLSKISQKYILENPDLPPVRDYTFKALTE